MNSLTCFSCLGVMETVANPAQHLAMLCKFLCLYRPYKESISKEMNNHDLNLHSVTKYSLGFPDLHFSIQ